MKKYWSEVGLEPMMICNTVPLELDELLSKNGSDLFDSSYNKADYILVLMGYILPQNIGFKLIIVLI